MAASSIGRRLNRSSAHRSEGSRHKKPMAAFTQRQLEYLRSQRLAHLATADAKGAPHVVPLRFRVATDGAAIEFGGRGFGCTKKYRAMKANPFPGRRAGSRSGGLRSSSHQAPDPWVDERLISWHVAECAGQHTHVVAVQVHRGQRRRRRHHRPRHQRHRCGGAGVEYDPGQRGRIPLIRSRQTAGWESSSSTRAAWPSAFTPYQARAIRPSSSTRNVERMTPVTGFPYIIFSP